MNNPVGYQTQIVGFSIEDDGLICVLRQNGWGVGSQRNYYRLGKHRIKKIVAIGEEMARRGEWGKRRGFGVTYGKKFHA